ncbi:MFS transporter [candidate division KSB1 bacterium]|nr:MFS transporter [candidate division KSB1 bacterium]
MKNIFTKGINRPFLWVPTLYMAEGVPYIIVNVVSVIMYKTLGVSNADIALYTGLLYLPWVIKPFWSPIVDLLGTNRFWILAMQLFMGAGFACIALTIPLPNFFQYTLAFLWLIAFGSATHDIAADGFYMNALTSHQQALYVGVRSTFYRLAMIIGQGLLVIMAGYIQNHSGLEAHSLQIVADSKTTVVQEIVHPDSLALSFPLDDDLRIVTSADTLVIALAPLSRQQVDDWRRQVDKWNHENGQMREIVSDDTDELIKPGWWSTQVSTPMANWIRTHFGPKTNFQAADRVGNIGIVYFQLSAPPPQGKEIVINFGQDGRNPDVKLILGNRFVFTAENWNQPAAALIQLDPKLKTRSDAAFIARAGNIPLSWVITIGATAVLFILFWMYHTFILPFPASAVRTHERRTIGDALKEFKLPFVTFFQKKYIGRSIAFLLIYRLGESQLVKLASPFLLDARENGGLGLTTGQVGFVYGTIGLMFLMAGGILGGIIASKFGLKKWLLWMAIAINLPDVVYIYLSQSLTDNFVLINLCVSIEQFGYGFGFTAYMLYQIYISRGKFETSHFAITTAFMALGMMLPGMFSGWLQELIGYQHFFIWVLIACLPIFFLIPFLNIDPEFGKKRNEH